MSYGNVHRYFLRTIASCGVLAVEEVRQVLTKITDDTVSLPNFIQEINDVIRPYQQSIKITHNETTNEEVVVFISESCDSISQSQKIFTAKELDYFRLLLEEIMSIDERLITGIHAINLVNRMNQKIPMEQAENLLGKWCKMYYLEKIGNNYTLGVRTIHEFEDYFKKYIPDAIRECYICKKNVFWGANCEACDKVIHNRCLNHYLEGIKKWPCCKRTFTSDHLKQMSQRNSSRLSQTNQSLESTQLSMQSQMIDQSNSYTEQNTSEDISMSDNKENRRSSRKRKRE